MFLSRLGHLLLFCVLAFVHTTAQAQQRIAVLELSGDGSIEETGLQFLADKIREAALVYLDTAVWEVMTQENMLVLLEANADDLAACEGECEVETGRLLGAHLVVAGSQLQFGSSYELVLRSYETESGKLLASASASAGSLDGLRAQLDDTCARLFGGRANAARPSTTGSKRIGGETSGWRMDGAQTYVVRFESVPDGAAVSLDGTLLCDVTPCSKEVSAGGHDVEMVLARYEPARQRLNIQGKAVVEVPMAPLFGWLSVRSSEPGVRITVDGESAGETPVRRLELAPGRHTVMTADERFHELGEEFSIQRDEEHVVDLAVSKRLGGLCCVANRMKLEDAGMSEAVIRALDGQ